MNVTLFSDASLCSHTGKGGWAAWLKSDEGTITGGGAFRHLTIDTGIAEAMAAVNGIHLGLRQGLIRPGCRVLIQTDNNSVWHILENQIRRKVTARALRKEGADVAALERDIDHRNMLIDLVVAKFSQLVERYRLEVRWRHVKGHRGKEDARSAVNTLCDKTAREHMERARGGRGKRRQMSRKQRIRKAMAEAEATRRKTAEAVGNVVPFPLHGKADAEPARSSAEVA
jgi:ribonuclease HI